ncbi:hypothetical protein ACO0QE_001560 [Hanseniaspora vineae]
MGSTGIKSANNKHKKVKVSNARAENVSRDSSAEQSSSEEQQSSAASSSEEEPEEDEMDLEGVSSEEAQSDDGDDDDDDDDDDDGDDGEDDHDEDEDDDDDDFPLKRSSKSSKSKHDDGSEAFSSAMNAILSSHLKAYDRADPIMARNKKILKKTEQDKLELKAKKALLAEKKRLLGKTRQQEIIPLEATQVTKTLEKERKLRKIAQKGVVKLFNVIMSTQVKTDKEVNDKYGNPNAAHKLGEKKKLISEVSKETFLDLVKAAGAEDDEE